MKIQVLYHYEIDAEAVKALRRYWQKRVTREQIREVLETEGRKGVDRRIQKGYAELKSDSQ